MEFTEDEVNDRWIEGSEFALFLLLTELPRDRNAEKMPISKQGFCQVAWRVKKWGGLGYDFGFGSSLLQFIVLSGEILCVFGFP